jgi:hypothetical protein
MNKEDILSISDWIKISVRFKGLCSSCKKKIDSGSYAYWSRISKSILHDSCYESLFLLPLNMQKINSINNEDGRGYIKKNKDAETSKNFALTISNKVNKKDGKYKEERKGKCFICDRNIDFNDDLIKILLNLYSNNGTANVMYCHYCLDSFDKDVYEKYKKKFMSKF